MTSDKHEFDPTILREYDVRGIMGQTLSIADALALGRAFGTVIVHSGGSNVAVGYDGRLSSPDLERAVVAGLTACGLKVRRVGLGPTPMLYYAVHKLGCDGGIQITGSHNPPDHNGFKMMLGQAPFFGENIQRLGRIASEGAFVNGPGGQETVELLDQYVARLVEDFKPGHKLTVVWDAGNGAAGEAMVKLTARLPGKHILLNEVIDGTFPAHHPDPTEEKNLVQLRDAVAQHGADLGIAFDGDGDRIGVIDGKGRILWGDQLVALLARPILEDKPGSTIIADVKASQTLFDEIARLGGKPLMWKTGHSLIKSKMKETGAPLGGEMSGHIFFADRYFGFDDALYAAVRVIELAAASKKSVAELRDELPKAVNTPEMRFACPDTRKFAVIDEVKARLERDGAKVDAVDGVRVQTEDGWWLLRASNTQAVLVARCEAKNKAGLDRLLKAVAVTLAASDVELPKD